MEKALTRCLLAAALLSSLPAATSSPACPSGSCASAGPESEGTAGVALLSKATGISRRQVDLNGGDTAGTVEAAQDELSEPEAAGLVMEEAEEGQEDEDELEEEEQLEEVPDTMSHVHDLPPEEEAVAYAPPTARLFGVDGVTGNKFQQCFIERQGTSQFRTPDNIENVIHDAHGQLNADGTNRGDWAKCLMPPMYTLLTIESFDEGDIQSGVFEQKMKAAADFYTAMKWLHNEACAHIRLSIADPALQQRIKEEINFNAPMGIGHQMRGAIETVAQKIVEQYRSQDPVTNPDNLALVALESAVNATDTAITQALSTSVVTMQDIGGALSPRSQLARMRQRAAELRQNMDAIRAFLASRPAFSSLLADDYGRRRRAGSPDKIPDTLQNVGKCGVRGSEPNDDSKIFEAGAFMIYTLSLGLNAGGEVTVATNSLGNITADALVAASGRMPLAKLLPAGAVEVEGEHVTYQDDLFSQGNLACGKRPDGAWTLVTADRDERRNNVTATQEEGYFCVWVLNDLDVLPENQRAGFSNTEFVGQSPERMAEIMNGNASHYASFFPADGNDKKYYHCHYTPRNSGSMRVHSFQHQAERYYPGGVRQVCGCDWRKLGMLVSRCDCTLDGEANGGCRRAEMEMLNERTQADLWSATAQGEASRVVAAHGDLAHGAIRSYVYNANGADTVRAFQDDTGRVRKTGSGGGPVCGVSDQGTPDGSARGFRRSLRLLSPGSRRRSSGHRWFTDFNKNGVESRDPPREFALSDIVAKRWSASGRERVAVPAGGVNLEFVDSNGAPCDALATADSCRPADAGGLTGERLTAFLSKFCETPASLYKVPTVDGAVPQGFGSVSAPLPRMPPGNFRRFARADFGRAANGDWLFCQNATCSGAASVPAVQGTLEQVAVGATSGVFGGAFRTAVGGANSSAVPSAVPERWLDQRDVAAGIFNHDVSTQHAGGTSAAARFAQGRVASEAGRASGVTCLNGKFVYAREGPGASRPVVSTVREALNRQGPRSSSGNWACRYRGVLCNDNNCNNQGGVEVPGPFVEPRAPMYR